MERKQRRWNVSIGKFFNRSLTRADENGPGNIEISLGYRRRGRVSSSLGSYKTDKKPINVPNTTRRLDHLRTCTLDDIVATKMASRCYKEMYGKSQFWTVEIN